MPASPASHEQSPTRFGTATLFWPKLMRKLLKKYGFVPDKLITDDLRSYGAAASDLGISKRHGRGRWLNNRAEFASTDSPTRTEDARVQERGLGPEISLNPRSNLQYLQCPTPPSRFSQNTSSLSCVGYRHVARGSRGRSKMFEMQNSRVLFSTT
jgi:hypothetical protein